jgi:hypothetical protein
MSRHCKLSPEEAEAAYQEYRQWLALHPVRIARKYGVSVSTLRNYFNRKHKTLRAA